MQAQTQWSVAPGEMARLMPEGEYAAEIFSAGDLPLRLPTGRSGNHMHPAFPGSPVLLGEQTFEVVHAETISGGSLRYGLNPWNEDLIYRRRITYGHAWLSPILAWRQRLARREAVRPWSWLLYPLVGNLPEDLQIAACWQLNLHPRLASISGALLEGFFYLLVYGQIRGTMGQYAALFFLPLFVLFLVPVMFRLFWGVLFGEISGAMPLNALYEAGQDLVPFARSLSDGPRPLSRRQFWRECQRPDIVENHPGGGVLVLSALPHLSWQERKRHRQGHTEYVVTTLDPQVDGQRIWFAYQATPLQNKVYGDRVEQDPLSPTAYIDELKAEVDLLWEKSRKFFPGLVSLLPAEVQTRALGSDGPRGIRSAALRTAMLTLVVGCGMGFGLPVWLPAWELALVLLALPFWLEGSFRLLQTFRGKFAPSLLGFLISDRMAAEHLPFEKHYRAAEAALVRKQIKDLS